MSSSKHHKREKSRHRSDRRSTTDDQRPLYDGSDTIQVQRSSTVPIVRKGPDAESLKTTMENLVFCIRSILGDSLDKESVVLMVQTLYNWMAFDPDSQISLPAGSGYMPIDRMWPHGSKINTRRDNQVRVDPTSPMALRDLNTEEGRNVARSVVSSGPGEVDQWLRRGAATTEDTRSSITRLHFDTRQQYFGAPMSMEPTPMSRSQTYDPSPYPAPLAPSYGNGADFINRHASATPVQRTTGNSSNTARHSIVQPRNDRVRLVPETPEASVGVPVQPASRARVRRNNRPGDQSTTPNEAMRYQNGGPISVTYAD